MHAQRLQKTVLDRTFEHVVLVKEHAEAHPQLLASTVHFGRPTARTRVMRNVRVPTREVLGHMLGGMGLGPVLAS